ncbi:MAG TPA: serine/threonine-protein kinase [Blastococcus sp.]
MTRPLIAPGHLVVGRYRLQSQIGGGGMGTVWLARDELLGRQVAVKQVLSPAGMSQAEADQLQQRALREGRIAARLSHPHAISVYDVALEHGQPWLVMEYLPSRSLAAVLIEDGVLRVDQVAQIGAQVADALAATHAAGIVHRDVKPANILIGQGDRVEGLVKITDFGISHASGDVTLTQTGQITGTPAFLAPEIARGQGMTPASDVFSLGATLYTCIEGQPPFGMEDNALGMLHKVAGGQILPPQRSGSMTRPLLDMLADEPTDRPTMLQVRDALARLVVGRDGDTTRVLVGRTDLGPSGSARGRTAVFDPVSAGAAGAAQAAPVSASAPSAPARVQGAEPAEPVAQWTPPPPPGPAAPSRAVPDDGRRRPRRRTGWLWVAVGALATVLAGLILFRVVDPAGNGASTGAQESPSITAGSSAAPTSAPSAATSAPTSAATTAASTAETTEASSAQESAAGRALTADKVRTFLRDYHALVLEDPERAYAMTGPTLRGAISEQNYADYWDQFSDVKISDVKATDGQSTATAKVQFRYRDGRRETETHRFTFVVEGDQLILDSDYKV